MQEEKELIPIKFESVMPSRAYTCIVLGNEEKKFAIYTDPPGGKAIKSHLTESEKPRPFTHDLIKMIFRGLDIKVKQIVISDLQDTIFFARLFLEQQIGDILHIVEIDCRPSDCIVLALIYRAPIFCTREVFNNSIAFVGL